MCGNTSIGDCDLSQCVGLGTVQHGVPSSIGVDTLIRSCRGAGDKVTPELHAFFRGAGVPEELLREIPRIAAEIKYYTCFISYGERDKAFAEKLQGDLVARGVSCWMFSLDATPGKPVQSDIRENLGTMEKMVVICSARSLVRPGVLKELKAQIYKSIDDIVPVSLDRRWTQEDFPVEWEGQNLKPFLTRQIYADFSDSSKYDESLARLLIGLARKDNL